MLLFFLICYLVSESWNNIRSQYLNLAVLMLKLFFKYASPSTLKCLRWRKNGLRRNYDLTILYMLPLTNDIPKIKFSNPYFQKYRFYPEQFNFVYSKLFLLSSGKFHSCFFFYRNQLQFLISAIRSSNNGIREDEDYFSSSSWKGCCEYSCILWQNWQWIQKQAVWPPLRSSWEEIIVTS